MSLEHASGAKPLVCIGLKKRQLHHQARHQNLMFLLDPGRRDLYSAILLGGAYRYL